MRLVPQATPATGAAANWENERLARSMDGPCATHATDGTSVAPVSAAWKAADARTFAATLRAFARPLARATYIYVF